MHGMTKNGYKFETKLGSGAHGEVWKAIKDGKAYAVKMMVKKDDDESAEIEEDFAKNFKLNFPYLVKYIDSFHEESMGHTYIYLVMEFCEHGNLLTLLNRYRNTGVDTNVAMKILVQLALALWYLETNNIMHRDIKLENVLLDKNDNVKLGDFGCFKMLAHSSYLAKTFVGTMPYISPEVLQNIPYGPKADVWSLGVLMYFVCMQKLPFTARNDFLLPMVVGTTGKGEGFEWNGKAWTPLPGKWVDVSVGFDGTIVGIDNNNKIQIVEADKTLTEIPGLLVQVSVRNRNDLMGVTTEGEVFRWDGIDWTQIDETETLSQVSIGEDGDAYGLDSKGYLFHLNTSSLWNTVIFDKRFKQFSVANKSQIAAVTMGEEIYYLKSPGLYCELDGTGVCVAAGNILWMVNKRGEIYSR